MSRQRIRDVIRFQQGYFAARPVLDMGADYAAPGSANVLFSGQGKAEPFKGIEPQFFGNGGSQMFQFLNTNASLGTKASPGKGSIFSYIGRSLWFIGSGEVMLFGNTLTGNPTASTTLKFRLLESGAYNGTTYTAGMAPPAIPTVAAGAAGTKLNGTYSVRLTAIRSKTGAESNASMSSATISLANQKLRITFPAAVGNGHDLWGVFVTRANFGDKGPHYSLPTALTGESPIGFVKESTVAASTLGGAGSRNLDFEWLDGDLISGELAPIDNGLPPLGTHAFVLEGCSAIVGCYGDTVTGVSTSSPGNMIAVSRAGFPEAFPADAAHLLALPEPPTLILPRAASGFVFIAGVSSLSMVRYTGAVTKAPLSLTVVWPDVGFDNYKNACMADGQLYGYTGTRGPVRIDAEGQPDYRFASGISSVFDGVSAADVVVGYDPASNMVVYGWTSGGVSRLICFNKAFEVWSAPINFEDLVTPPTGSPAIIKGMVTTANSLEIILDTGVTNYVIHSFNTGSGSTWKLRSAWRDGGYPEKNKTITSLKMATTNDTGNPITLSIYKNLNSTTPDFTVAHTPSGAAEHLLKRINVRNAKTYAVHLQGTDNNTIGLEASVEAVASEIDT